MLLGNPVEIRYVLVIGCTTPHRRRTPGGGGLELNTKIYPSASNNTPPPALTKILESSVPMSLLIVSKSNNCEEYSCYIS